MVKRFVFDLCDVILLLEHRQIAVKLHKFSSIRHQFAPDDLFTFLFHTNQGCINSYEEGRMSSLVRYYLPLAPRHVLGTLAVSRRIDDQWS